MHSSKQVLNLLEEQVRRVEQRIDALLLVGGFSGSEYLFKRIDVCKITRRPRAFSCFTTLRMLNFVI